MEDTDDKVTEVVQFQAERGAGGRFLTKPKGIEQHAFTKENAAEMSKKRWQKFREAAADAVAAEMGSITPGVTTPQQAWGVLNARLAAQIMDSEKPRGSDLVDLGRNMGAIPNAYERTELENPSGGSLDGTSDAVMQLIGILRDVLQDKARRPDVIDGSATNVTDTRNE